MPTPQPEPPGWNGPVSYHAARLYDHLPPRFSDLQLGHAADELGLTYVEAAVALQEWQAFELVTSGPRLRPEAGRVYAKVDDFKPWL